VKGPKLLIIRRITEYIIAAYAMSVYEVGFLVKYRDGQDLDIKRKLNAIVVDLNHHIVMFLKCFTLTET